MKRLVIMLALSAVAFGQGVIVPTQQVLKTVNGVTSPVANATITVCAANTSGIPCSPVLSSALFKDAALTQPLTNPFTSDANGNYVFAMASGNYTVTVSAASFVGYSYQITVPLAAGANLSFTGATTFSGPANLNGGGSLIGTFSGPATFNGTNTFTGSTDIGILDNSCKVPSTKYPAIVSAEADTTNCKSIAVSDKSQALYTETLSANQTWTVPIRFHSCAAISMGTNTLTIPSSSTSDGFFMVSDSVQGLGNTNFCGVVFTYTGSGAPMTFGGTTQRNFQWHIQGITLNIINAGTAVTGMTFNNLFNSVVDGVQVGCNQSGTNTQVGLLFNGSGTPGFADLVTIQNSRAVNCQVPLSFTGVTNGYMVLGGASEYNCGNTTSSVGMKLASGAGTVFIFWPDVESCTIGLEIAGSFTRGFVRLENSGTACVQYDSGATYNNIYTEATSCGAPVDNSTLNTNNFMTFDSHDLPCGNTANLIPTFAKGYRAGQGGIDELCNANIGANIATWGRAGLLRTQTPNAAAVGTGLWGACDFTTTDVCSGVIAESTGAVALKWGLLAANGNMPGQNVRGNLNTNGSIDFLNAAPFSSGAANLARCGSDATGNLKCSYNNGTLFVQTQTIASGTATMTTAAITAPACGTTVTVAAANVATTDTITWAFNAAPAGTNAGIVAWPTSGNVNFAYCPGVTETPAAATINWRVVR